MIWKKAYSNLVVAGILTICFTIVTLLNVIGPLHMNADGTMNELSGLALISILYYLFGLAVTWGAYLFFRNKPKFLFFFLILFGISFILIQNYMWGLWGSN